MRSVDNCQCQSQDKSTPETREQSLERRSLVNWKDKILDKNKKKYVSSIMIFYNNFLSISGKVYERKKFQTS